MLLTRIFSENPSTMPSANISPILFLELFKVRTSWSNLASSLRLSGHDFDFKETLSHDYINPSRSQKAFVFFSYRNRFWISVKSNPDSMYFVCSFSIARARFSMQFLRARPDDSRAWDMIRSALIIIIRTYFNHCSRLKAQDTK